LSERREVVVAADDPLGVEQPGGELAVVPRCARGDGEWRRLTVGRREPVRR